LILSHHTHRNHPDQTVDVEVHLENDIKLVQSTTEAFLDNPVEVQRLELLSALEILDQQTAASDAYEADIVGSAVFGHAYRGSVIGETSQIPISNAVPSSLFQAQAGLVKAAKAAVSDPSPNALGNLGTALATLRTLPCHGQGENRPKDRFETARWRQGSYGASRQAVALRKPLLGRLAWTQAAFEVKPLSIAVPVLRAIRSRRTESSAGGEKAGA